MGAIEPIRLPKDAQSSVPFAEQFVTLSKQEHIQLVAELRSFKTLHRRSVNRAASQKKRLMQIIRDMKMRAKEREAALRTELELAQAKIRSLEKRMFGRKSECSKGGTEQQSASGRRASRGHQPGAKGHGRTRDENLPAVVETITIEAPHCPKCQQPFGDFPGTENSEIVEIEVRAYRRQIRRQRYRRSCNCEGTPGIVTAPTPPRLIAGGKFGVSVWVSVLLDKYLYGRPSHRLLQDFSDHGLTMAPGTLAGGLQLIAPLFEQLEQALANKLRSESHWHADETRWAVFVDVEGKVGHRWYMWVFHSKSAIHYVIDKSRSAEVIEVELAGVDRGIISCDRYSAYKKFSRLHPLVLLAFCWAHQRRDFLELANAYPDCAKWAMTWVDAIGELYRLNALRLAEPPETGEHDACHAALKTAVDAMAGRISDSLSDRRLPEPATKVMQSMKGHWGGLTVFVDHPWVPMDNNVAERDARGPVVGRKNFYGSGSLWSSELAATMYSLLMTVKLWGINPRAWLTAYLQACAENGGHAPESIDRFLPWTMDSVRLAALRNPAGKRDSGECIDSS